MFLKVETEQNKKKKKKTPAIVAFGDMLRRNKDLLPKPKSLVIFTVMSSFTPQWVVAESLEEKKYREKEKKKKKLALF